MDHEAPVDGLRRIWVIVGDVALWVDGDETFAGMCWIRDNFAQMFHAEADQRLELVVDLRRQVFEGVTTSASSCLGQNLSQVQAIGKVLDAKDYASLLGMPGTGKTTVVAEVSRRLERVGKMELVASYTHPGVNTILGKVVGGWGVEEEFGILRLGNGQGESVWVLKCSILEI